MYIECSRNVPNCFAFGEQLVRNFSLIRIELTRSAEAHTALFCRFTTGAGPLAN